jgi:phage portal protein BeeE
MGIVSRLATWLVSKSTAGTSLDSIWGEYGGSNSVTGIRINQETALNATAVLAAVTILSEDVAKLGWSVFRNADGEAKKEAKDHFLYDLLQEPNDWMNGLELREMMQVGLILRGNAYAVISEKLSRYPNRADPVESGSRFGVDIHGRKYLLSPDVEQRSRQGADKFVRHVDDCGRRHAAHQGVFA